MVERMVYMFVMFMFVILNRGLEASQHRRTSLVPSCLKMLAKVSDSQQASLRDAAQVIE
jgi:hypothetical protein